MDQVNRSIYIELMNREIFKFSTTEITKYLKENYVSKKSIISFKEGHEIPSVELLDVAIGKVVKKALKNGIDEDKEIIRLVPMNLPREHPISVPLRPASQDCRHQQQNDWSDDACILVVNGLKHTVMLGSV